MPQIRVGENATWSLYIPFLFLDIASNFQTYFLAEGTPDLIITDCAAQS
jgi:hypothetical protein